MRKTTIAIDDEKLEAVQEALGTSGITETVDRALREVLAAEARRREVERLTTCSITDLEVLYSARDGREYEEWRADRARAYELIPIEQPTLNRAVEVQGLLAERGAHRWVSVPDLIIAAAAERFGVTLLHYDADFDLIASVTGQRCEWVVARGTVD